MTRPDSPGHGPADRRQWETTETEDRRALRREHLLAALAAHLAAGHAADRPDRTDPPPAIERVRDRVRRHELDWVEVRGHRGDDPDVRAVRVWLDPELTDPDPGRLRAALGATTDDMTVEQAAEAISTALDEPPGD